MTGFMLGADASVLCPHAAPAIIVPTGTRVLLSGQPTALLGDATTVAGCPLASATPPSPCLTVSWLTGSTRVLVQGTPALLQDSQGLAMNPLQAPQGMAAVLLTQSRVMAG